MAVNAELISQMRKSYLQFVAAAVVYAAFAVYLYWPHFDAFAGWNCLLPLGGLVAACGGFILSRCWVAGFTGSFLAGSIYAFGPYCLGLGKFHPTAAICAATIPWLFCPAAFGPKGKWRWLRFPLCVLPFAAIIIFFQAGSHFRLFAVPLQVRLRPDDLIGLLAPVVAAERGNELVGFYHVPLAALLLGVSMFVAAKRYSVAVIFAIGVALAFCGPVLNISPLIWLSVAVLCCSVLIGEGFEGLVHAGYGDRKWVLSAAVLELSLAVVTLLLATKYASLFAGFGMKYANLFTDAAKMHIAGAIAVGATFFLTRGKSRLVPLRLAILSAAVAVDVFLSAGYIIDKTL